MSNSLSIQSNSVQLNIPFDASKLSNRQRMLLKQLGQISINSFLAYVESFKGKRNRNPGIRAYDAASLQHEAVDPLNKRPNSIIRLLNQKFDYFSATSVSSDKVAQGLAVGVEIECLIPRYSEGYAEHLCQDGCDDEECDNFSDTIESEDNVRDRISEIFRTYKVKNTFIKGDGSLTDSDRLCGVEIVTIVPANNFENLERICKALRELGAKVDKTCGLHVHLDARIHNHKAITRNLFNALPLLKSMVPATRVHNYYCQQDVSRGNNRYAKINTTSYKKHRTIEVRLHSGTVDFTKISQWITVLRSIALTEKRLNASKTYDIQYIADTLNWNEATMEYVAQRQELFKQGHATLNGNASTEAEQAA